MLIMMKNMFGIDPDQNSKKGIVLACARFGADDFSFDSISTGRCPVLMPTPRWG